MSFLNFAALQSLSSISATDQLLISIDNGLSGAAGFGRVELQTLDQGLGVYSTVQTNSAAWGITTDSGVRALTSQWDSTYTTVNSSSATWGTDAAVRALTANWDSTFTTVSSTSAQWKQTLSYNAATAALSISDGNTISLSALSGTGSGGGSSTYRRTTLTLATLSTTGTISSNALSADQFVVALSGISLSATIGAPTNAYDAQIIMWNLRYTTNIARVSLAASFRTPITTLNWTVSANRMDIMAAKYNALDNKWDVISFAPGYII